MRQLTAYASYHDNLGELLIGRARFCNLDGSPAQVYGLDNAHQQFIPLGSTIFTNSSGQLEPQVFLDDYDYLIFFDKYIGDGTMAEDDDPESWEEQGSAVDRYNTLGIELIGMTTRAISTITDLHASLPLDEGEVVLLLGYNDPGDKPPIYYKWDAESTDQDNGGSVIKVTDQERGRWVFIECPAYLDVRHFGAFPISDAISEASQRYAIQRAGLYAHQNSCGIYFPANDAAIYYDISGLTLYDVDCNPAARVFAIDDTPATINGIVKIYCGGNTLGRIELISREVRSSWEGEYQMVTLSPTEKLIIDSVINTDNRSWTGIHVDCLVETGRVSFYECVISSFKKLGDSCYFRGCTLSESMFSDATDFDTITIHSSVVIDIEEWPTTWKWLKLRVQKSNQTIDFKGRTLYANCNGIIVWPGGITFKNATFTNGFIITQDTIGLENCGGPVQLNASLQTLVCDNCSLTITTLQSGRPNVIIKNNSEVSFLNGFGAFTCGEFSADSSTVHGNINANVNVVAYNTIFSNDITVYGILNLQRCTVAGATYQHANDARFMVTLLNNTLGGSYYMFGAPSLQSVVSGKIEYNNSNATAGLAIIIDRTNFDPDETHHHYSYKYNTGAFIPDVSTVQGTYTAVPFHYIDSQNSSLAQTTQAYHQFCVPTEQNYGLIYNDTVAFDNAIFFTIGTSNILVKMKVRTLVNAGCSATSTTEFILLGRFNQDFTWDLLCQKSGTWVPTGLNFVWSTYPVTYPTSFIFGYAVHVDEASTLPASWNLDMIVDYSIIRS